MRVQKKLVQEAGKYLVLVRAEAESKKVATWVLAQVGTVQVRVSRLPHDKSNDSCQIPTFE